MLLIPWYSNEKQQRNLFKIHHVFTKETVEILALSVQNVWSHSKGNDQFAQLPLQFLHCQKSQVFFMKQFWRSFTLQGTNISHLGKRKIIFKSTLVGDVLVPRKLIYMMRHLSILAAGKARCARAGFAKRNAKQITTWATPQTTGNFNLKKTSLKKNPNPHLHGFYYENDWESSKSIPTKWSFNSDLPYSRK